MLTVLKLVSSLAWFFHFESHSSFADLFSGVGADEEPIISGEYDTGSLETTTVSTVMEKDLPLDLYDIGYVGTWERFCDPQEIEKEFAFYPHYHVQMLMRNQICNLRRENRIDRLAMLPFAVYKYCNMMKKRIDSFLVEFISKFSLGDDNKKMELLDEGPIMNFTECYKEVLSEFKRKCIGETNPFYEMFHPLLGRACFAEWTSSEEIVRHIHDVCNGKWITDQIDWDPILASIKFKDDKETRGSTMPTTSSIVNLNRFA